MLRRFFEDIKPGGQLLALGLIFVLFFIVAIGASVFITLLSGDGDVQYATLACSQIISFAGTAVVFAYLFYDRPFRHLGLCSSERMGTKVVVSCLILICLLPLSDWLTRINDSMHLPQSLAAFEESMRLMGERAQSQLESFLMRDGIGALMGNLVVLALVPAICEELLFRGALQQLFCRIVNNSNVAILLTAALFSLFHGELFAFLPRFVLGAALGYLFFYGGSLWINATVHFLNNALAIILFYLGNRGIVDMKYADTLNAPWYIALLGLLLSVVFFYLFFRRQGTKCEGEEK